MAGPVKTADDLNSRLDEILRDFSAPVRPEGWPAGVPEPVSGDMASRFVQRDDGTLQIYLLFHNPDAGSPQPFIAMTPEEAQAMFQEKLVVPIHNQVTAYNASPEVLDGEPDKGVVAQLQLLKDTRKEYQDTLRDTVRDARSTPPEQAQAESIPEAILLNSSLVQYTPPPAPEPAPTPEPAPESEPVTAVAPDVHTQEDIAPPPEPVPEVAEPPKVDSQFILANSGLILPENATPNDLYTQALNVHRALVHGARLPDGQMVELTEEQKQKLIDQFASYDEGHEAHRYTDILNAAGPDNYGVIQGTLFEAAQARPQNVPAPEEAPGISKGGKEALEKKLGEIWDGKVPDNIGALMEMVMQDPQSVDDAIETVPPEKLLENFGHAPVAQDVQTVRLEDGRVHMLWQEKAPEGGIDYVLKSPDALQQMFSETVGGMNKNVDESQIQMVAALRAAQIQLIREQPDIDLAQNLDTEMDESMKAAIARHNGDEIAAEAIEKDIPAATVGAPGPSQ